METRSFSEANEAQRKFWSDGPGLNWVDLKDVLDVLHSRIADVVIDAAAVQPGERILDIGCGAGATTLTLARLAGPQGHVTGLDVSDTLLAAAQARANALTDIAPDFVLADAQVWRPSEPVDLCVSRMGVMFFADPAAAFRNILCMLRPGGRLAFICWRGMEENPWFEMPLAAAIDRLGAAEPGDPDGPGPMALRNPVRIHDLLEQAGFEDISVIPANTTLLVPDGTAAAAALALRIGPAVRHIRDKQGTQADMTAIHASLLDGLACYETPEGVILPAAMHLVTARRP